MRCTVVGAGAWGTALAYVLARNGHPVTIWAYEPDVVESINTRHANVRFLAGAPLHPSLTATGNLAAASADAELIAYVTPSHVLRAVVRREAAAVRDVVLLVASKGIERETLA